MIQGDRSKDFLSRDKRKNGQRVRERETERKREREREREKERDIYTDREDIG